MTALRRTLRTAEDLAGAGLVDTDRRAITERIAARYAVAITPEMTMLVDRRADDDPIARQFVPRVAELATDPAERSDPIGDDANSPVPGIVHRYPDRVLLKITGVCPVYCRFCFRREMVGPEAGRSLDEAQLGAAIAYIARRPAIAEVIVTGGDPLILSPRRIRDLTRALDAIPHVAVIRWHTRVPAVSPGRVTPELADGIAVTGKLVRLALHANHPREMTVAARAALRRLADRGVSLLSQSVLLRGINDQPAILGDLVQSFVTAGVHPYYLHHGDLAPGTAHFRTRLCDGMVLMDELHARLPDVPLPRYVLDIPGGFGKVPVSAPHVVMTGDGAYRVTDRHGRIHAYRDHCALAQPIR